MASLTNHISTLSLLLIVFNILLPASCVAAHRKLLPPIQEQPLVLKHHNGAVLSGNVTVNLVWYGNFSSIQRSIIVDFLQSLSYVDSPSPSPSVSSWWRTTSEYRYRGRRSKNSVAVGDQILDERYSLGKLLDDSQLLTLASKSPKKHGSIDVVLTSADVAVNRFCVSRCGSHGSGRVGSARFPYAWVGNSAEQCPGQCAWPFHQPMYGPQAPPLVPPNGDVGVDGMIVNLATVLAGAVTNPFSDGYFQGPALAPLEAVSVCTGVFGNGAYPGYPGRVLVDGATGASYNAVGVNGRKYLVPAMWDPETSKCKSVV